jgi:N-acetylneuraminic acid mutarotase
MAKALPAGRPLRRRPMFGLFDPDGWAWATTKAVFWLLVLIITLGYIPDRAYYFVVSRTIDLGILGWSPVNLCPPENGKDMPCPVPAGGIIPWQASPSEVALPQARTAGSAAQLGTNLLYIGGSDGAAPTATTFVAQLDKGNVGAWAEGPALPEARTNASLAILSGTAYLVGGLGADGQPTTTVWSIGLDPESGDLGTWAPVKGVTLPAARAGAGVVAVTDGIVVAGGAGPDGQPTSTVWKSTLDDKGALGQFEEQPSLLQPVTDASAAFEGGYLWVYGGSDVNGPTASVQRAAYGRILPTATEEPEATPDTSQPERVLQWAVSGADLPEPRTGGAAFAANGALYLVGGSDGTTPRRELYWALPDASGNLAGGGWQHIDKTDLPDGVVDAAPVVTGSTVIIIGGSASGGPVTSSFRASLAPEEPFFRLGIAGVVVPGLKIGGEIGQQLGYLAAAGVGTGNFVILVAIGWAYNHRPRIAAWLERRRADREAKAAS